MPETCIYHGEVVHRRFHPVKHELRYRVFNVFADVDQLDELGSKLKLFSYNRFNLFSIMDRNHGKGDGGSVSDHAWSLVRATSAGHSIVRIFMFCYPSVLGYVFNPLTVYYAYDGEDRLSLMIYEVNNTFGGRHSYVVPVGETLTQHAPKHFFVSPFNAVEGRYDFRFSLPAQRLALGITLTVDRQPRLKAYVTGKKIDLTDVNLLRSFAGIPFLTLKVIAAIHLQALQLWWKGLPLISRPKSPNHTVDVLPEASQNP